MKVKMGDNKRRYSAATAEIIKYLNVENAKLCAFVMVLGFVVYHGLIHAKYGDDSCHWLLSEGRLQGENLWQPFGCMIHEYTKSETRNCMHYIAYWGGRNLIVFLGDSRIRQQYWKFVSLVSGTERGDDEKSHTDLYFKDDNINLEIRFFWTPILNGSMYKVYEDWLRDPPDRRPSVIVTGSGTWTMKLSNGTLEGLEEYKDNLTTLLPLMDKLGNSTKILWMLQEPVREKLCQNYSRHFLTNTQIDSYNTAAENILSDASVKLWKSAHLIGEDLLDTSTDGLHMGTEPLTWDLQILVNLYCNDHMNFDDGTCCSSREPVTALQIISASLFGTCLVLAFCMCAWKKRQTLSSTSNKVRFQVPYNEIEQLIADNTNTTTTTGTSSSSSDDSTNFPTITQIGYQNEGNAEAVSAGNSSTGMAAVQDIGGGTRSKRNLHMRTSSNSSIDRNVGRNVDHSAAAAAEKQDGAAKSGGNCKRGGDKGPVSNGLVSIPAGLGNGFYELMVSLARLGVIMMYFFLCDRTSFFMKENKYYTHVNFFLPFSYLMIVGIFFTETSQYTTILHRDQTDEWKGWMQLVILIYHMTGASKVLSIYMQIRVLVSSYLFLSGFGHFYYFFRTGDFSLHRFCTVLFRFNFLVVLLCFTMNRPYQFYYFVPLVSFWFMISYVIMGIWPHITTKSTDIYPLHYLYMILKFVILVIAITLLYASEVLFEDIFLSHPIKALFVTSDDSITDWAFRWKIDRYSTVFGMAFAFALLVSKKLKLVSDSDSRTLYSRGISWLISVLAVAGLAGYFTFASFCRNKEECNEVHAYISFLPIISFIVLRNVPGWLRMKYSSFFAWFGRIALELFISQYHMWLASDTHGILVLVPSYPVLNLTLTSFIFVCAAHEIHCVTATLVQYFVPSDWKRLLRNIIIFFIVLLPVAITRGAFG